MSVYVQGHAHNLATLGGQGCCPQHVAGPVRNLNELATHRLEWAAQRPSISTFVGGARPQNFSLPTPKIQMSKTMPNESPC